MYRNAVEQPQIKIRDLRQLSHQGIPDELRAIYWKVSHKLSVVLTVRQILLGYLPTDRSKWDDALRKSRELYQQWHLDLLVNPRKELEEREAREKAEKEADPELQEITVSDHV